MATTKNITMRQFNGTDYDTLYPKTTSKQVEGIYNKEETLANGTKSLYGLAEASVPDDAFQKILTNFNKSDSKINDITPKIGDIALSARKGLGGKWLLCNGDDISPTTYPDLANLIRGIYGKTLSTYSLKPGRIAYYNGMWVAVAQALETSDGNPYIFYTFDPSKTWYSIKIASLNPSQERHIYLEDIACYNGTWVIVGRYIDTSSDTYPKVYVSTNPTSSSSWKDVVVSASRSFDLGGVACYNGTWVAIDAYGKGIAVSTNPASSWNFINMESQIGMNSTSSIYCYNGTWVICGMSGTRHPAIITTTNPSSTWTQYILDSTTMGAGIDIACYNGTWVIAGNTGGNGVISSDSNSTIFTTTNLAGTWSKKILTTTGNEGLDGVTCCNGVWYVVSGQTGAIYYTTTPASYWSPVLIPPSTTILPNKLYSIASSDDIWVAMGYTSDNLPYAMTNAYYKLPTISPDRAYAYIKALE